MAKRGSNKNIKNIKQPNPPGRFAPPGGTSPPTGTTSGATPSDEGSRPPLGQQPPVLPPIAEWQSRGEVLHMIIAAAATLAALVGGWLWRLPVPTIGVLMLVAGVQIYEFLEGRFGFPGQRPPEGLRRWARRVISFGLAGMVAASLLVGQWNPPQGGPVVPAPPEKSAAAVVLIDGLPEPTKEEWAKREIVGKGVVLPWMFRGEWLDSEAEGGFRLSIENKVFVKCNIVGPAVVIPSRTSIDRSNVFQLPILGGPNGKVAGTESILIAHDNPSGGFDGTIQLVDCVFRECTFKAISVVASKKDMETIKAGVVGVRSGP